MYLITGATGCVGGVVTRHLLKEGVESNRIVALRREGSGAERESTSADVRWIVADLADGHVRIPDSIPPLIACIHSAALVHAPGATAEAFVQTNVRGTLRLAESLAKHSPGSRFVFLSTMAVEDPSARTSPYAVSKAKAEEALLARCDTLDLEVIVLRLATVYGPGDRGHMALLARSMARRVYRRMAPANTLKTVVSTERVVRAVMAALHPDVPSGTVALVADPTPLELSRIEDAFARAAGTPSPGRIPWPFALGLATIGSAIGVLPGVRPPLDLRRLRTLARPVALRPYGPDPILQALTEDTTPFEDRIMEHYGTPSSPALR